ncbi:MAG: hypothetical protein J1E80_08295 [Desulfovibrionaceae bacterium]|nr:hypothetical protein [Desulfovibrionaceae bacterium]
MLCSKHLNRFPSVRSFIHGLSVYFRKSGRLSQRTDDDDGAFQIPLFRACQLLSCLNHPIGLKFMEHQDTLKDLLNTRNLSLLAHGFQPVDFDTCTKMKKYVLEFLDISEDALTVFPVLTATALEG